MPLYDMEIVEVFSTDSLHRGERGVGTHSVSREIVFLVRSWLKLLVSS